MILVWAVVAICGLLPLYLVRFHLGFLPMTFLEAMILILFIVFLVRNRFKIKDLRLKVPGYWLVIMAMWLLAATISIFVSPDRIAALGIWKAYFLEPILFLIIFVSVIKKENLKWVWYALSFSAIYISLFAIYQKFTGWGIPNPLWQAEATRRVTSFFGYPNAIGLFLAPLVPIFIAQLTAYSLQLKDLTWKKLLVISYWLLVIGVSIMAIYWAHSTGALVGIGAGLLFMLIVVAIKRPLIRRDESGIRNPRSSPAIGGASRGRQESGVTKFIIHNSCFIILVLCVFVVGIVLKNSPTLRSEILLHDWSGQVRQKIWGETLTMLKDRPLLGAGLAGYQQTFTPYHQAKYIEIFLYPHNEFLNFWSETGLFGLLVFLWTVLYFFYQGIKKLLVTGYWLLVTSIMASMIVILVHGLVDVPYFKNDLSILFWIVVGSLIIIKQESENHSSPVKGRLEGVLDDS